MLNSDYKSNKLNPTFHHAECYFLQIGDVKCVSLTLLNIISVI